MIDGDSRRIISKIKKVVLLVFREGFYDSDEELLVDAALTFSHPVNLAYRYSHSLG